MREWKHIDRITVLGLVLFPSLLYMPPAYAYLDPGAGSILLQSLLAGLATAAAVASIFWQRLRSFVSALFSTKKSTEKSPEENADKS
jgi:hypothetical protein